MHGAAVSSNLKMRLALMSNLRLLAVVMSWRW